MGELKKTPLYNEHVKLGAKIINFNGWQMPVYYSNVIEEHINVRGKSGVFDIGHMGRFFIEGKGAFDFIQHVLTTDLRKLVDGKAFYSVMCLENGGVVDDLIAYSFNDDKYMLVVNASNIEKDFKWLVSKKGSFDVKLINKTYETANLGLQGPNSEEILQKLTDFDLAGLKRFFFVEANVNNVPTIISRTGYTGEDGFELYFPVEDASKQWNTLLEVGKENGIKPIGLGARDTLRTEAGYSLYGHELNEDVNPFEVGTGFVVKFGKDSFVGKDALEKIKEQGIKRKIIAFEMLKRGIPRQNYEVYKGDDKIGYVTSGTMSPTFKKGIGMAFVNINEVVEENEIHIKIREKLYSAKIVKKPIYAFHGGGK